MAGLTKDEMDALFKGLREQVPPENGDSKQVSSERVKPFVVRTIRSFTRIQMIALRTVHERLAWQMSSMLTDGLEAICRVELEGLEERTVEDLGDSLETITAAVFACTPLDGLILMQMSPELVYFLVDRILGGPGTLPEGKYACSETETGLLRQVFNDLEDCLKKAWLPVIELTVKEWNLLANVRLEHMLSPKDRLIRVVFRVKLGEVVAPITWVIPCGSLYPIRGRLAKGGIGSGFPMEPEEENQKVLKRHLQDTPLHLRAVLGGTQLTLGEVRDLSIGDVIRLDQKSGDEVLVHVEDRLCFVGLFGMYKGMRSVKVQSIAEEESECYTESIDGEEENDGEE
jgi:flagellar motor switch protein FliM